MALEQILSTYGYFALLIGAFVEGETVLIVAGFLVHQGYMNLVPAILFGLAGTVAGDQLCFHIGRQRGMVFLEKRPVWKEKSERLSPLLQRHLVPICICFRFLYGFRTITPILIGSTGLKPLRFLLFDLIGSGIWTVTILVLGYLFGNVITLIIEEIERYELWVIGGVFIAGVLAWILHFYRKPRKTQ